MFLCIKTTNTTYVTLIPFLSAVASIFHPFPLFFSVRLSVIIQRQDYSGVVKEMTPPEDVPNDAFKITHAQTLIFFMRH